MRYIFTWWVIGLVFFCGMRQVDAAYLTLESDLKIFHVGDDVVVTVALDTENQTINTVGVTVMYPKEFLQYEDYDDGDSAVSLWVARPEQSTDGQITMSGITPGGFSGAAIEIVSLRFKTTALGQGVLSAQDLEVLLHDGQGTPAQTQVENIHMAVVAGPSTLDMRMVDDEQPEVFVPHIVHDPDLFEGAHTLIFTTEDKGSGLDHFAVKEGWFGHYVEVESPYVLQYQNLDKKIYVKAVDKNGNERIAILYPQTGVGKHEQSLRIVGILVLCLLALYFVRTSYRTRLV